MFTGKQANQIIKKKKSKKIVKKNRQLSFFWKLFPLVMLLGVSFLFFYLFKDLPSPRKLASDQFPVSTLIYDRNDKLLYEIYGEQNRTPIKLDQLPDYVKQATIAIEDKDFYQHGAFDFRGILRALINIIFKQKLQGGSTITQQLVKTTLLSPERTVRRKIREATLAAITEFIYNKNQILEMYLNHVPYGGTAYGIEQASQKYFNKPAKDLTLAEAALLAGLPAAPTYYSPFGANPQLAKNRQKLVLQRMVEEGYISQKQADQAYSEKTEFYHRRKYQGSSFCNVY
jgi:membrane peptidoglycan carboxypeptidase